MPKFKIAQEQVNILRACAANESVPRISEKGVLLEPGWRTNTEDPNKECSMNIALVTDDPEWRDTDLHDYGEWSEFRKGVELTEDGRGVFDFYIRRRFDEYKDLHGNVLLHVENGEMVRVTGYGRNPLRWSKEGGFT